MINKKNFDLIVFSPWSGDKDDKRKLRHYNFIECLEKKHNINICLIVENNYFGFKRKKLKELESEIFYVPAFNITKGSNKKIKRLISMLLYPLFSIHLFITKSSIRNAKKYWVSSPHPGATVTGLFVGLFNNNFLYEIRDPWPELPIKTGLIKKNSIISKIFKKIDIKAQRRSKAILLTSYSYEKYLRPENKSKSIVVSNGIPFASLQNYSHKFMNNKVLNLVFAGGCARAFKMEVIFKAISIAKLKDKNLNIILKLYIDPIEKDRFIPTINELEISKNIVFSDKVPYSEMLSAIKYSDFYILHITDQEIFKHDINSNKLLDAFTCLTPVIFAANTKLNHVKLSGGGICCIPDSPAALASSLIYASMLPQNEYDDFSLNMKNYATKNLAIESKVDEIYNLF